MNKYSCNHTPTLPTKNIPNNMHKAEKIISQFSMVTECNQCTKIFLCVLRMNTVISICKKSIIYNGNQN